MSPPEITQWDSGSIGRTIDEAVALIEQRKFPQAEQACQKILNVAPGHFGALFLLGSIKIQLGQNAGGATLMAAAARANPKSAEAHFNLGVALGKLNRHAEAIASYDRALQFKTDFATAWCNRGIELGQLGRLEEALESYGRALDIKPDFPEALNNQANALRRLGRYRDALDSYDKALRIKPDYAAALVNRADTLLTLEQPEEALISCDRALRVDPHSAGALNNRGNALAALGRWDEALESHNRALTIRPNHAEALNNGGNALARLNRLAEALDYYDRAISVKPDYPDAWTNRGLALAASGRHGDAITSYDKALEISSDRPDVWNERGISLAHVGRSADALASYDRALLIAPAHAQALFNRGNILKRLQRHDEAMASYRLALRIEPDLPYALGALAECALLTCDWAELDRLSPLLTARAKAGTLLISPFTALCVLDHSGQQLTVARNHLRHAIPVLPQRLEARPIADHGKIRVAYVSADFRQHPVASLIVELFERHDRARFDVVVISLGPDDRSDLRARLISASDEFHDVRRMSDRDAAKLIVGREIDIAVDLMGHTDHSRPGIFAHRPAPIQVNYLGYPGTTGAPFMDYIIGDAQVSPFEEQSIFSERIVHLPASYLPNDSKKSIARRRMTRAECGLPENGFVFCCFNSSYKITAPMFDIWMSLLRAVEGGVLWLSQFNHAAADKLREAARRRGVEPNRLIFASRLPSLEDHLARHRMADLFLDTLPYNAHTTASEALWAGLPVLTCKGGTFAGRAGASLLDAVGFPELVTDNLQDYEALARKLAAEPALLQAYRDRLEHNRLACALFDAERYRRSIERAYLMMCDIFRRGEPPRSFSVDASSADNSEAHNEAAR